MSNSKFDLSTKEGYLAFHKDACEKMHDITRRKNADYTGGASDPFANFAVVGNVGVCSVEQGFLVRMLDKFMRISALADGTRQAQVKDESIEDTLLDLANYSILLAGYLKKKRATPTQGEAAPARPANKKWQYHYVDSEAMAAPCAGTARGPIFTSATAAGTSPFATGRTVAELIDQKVYVLFEVDA